MAEIKLNLESIKNLKEYLEKNNYDTVSRFLNNFVNFNNSSHKSFVTNTINHDSLDNKLVNSN